MSIRTTCIGAWPKPGYVKLPDWFNLPAGPDTADPTAGWQAAMDALGEEGGEIIARGVAEAVHDQIEAGIDVPTDGEIARENYIHYHCRRLHGFDFVNLTSRALRGGAYSANLPTIVSPVSAGSPFLAADWRRAQSFTERPVKITMPGPMTIADTTFDAFYHDPEKLGAALADALNVEVRSLAEAGCRHIQIDEPLFARRPEAALEYGFEHLERAFHGCPREVVRVVHACCGYPDRLDRTDYPKADPGAYLRLADAFEDAAIDAVSIEDAHRPNDLSLLDRLPTTRIVLGVVAIARSRVESVEEIRARLAEALEHVDADRLIAAPDCGLGLLGRDLAKRKLRNLCLAAGSV